MDNKQLKTYIEQQITMFENASKEAEKKLYANEEIASDIRILRLCDYIRYNAYLDILKQIAQYDLATKKFFKEKEEQTQIANPIRKVLIAQLEELVNPAQAKVIKHIEEDLLSPTDACNNISFVTWMYRMQGALQVILGTPEYSSEIKEKICKTIQKLVAIKCL